MKGKRPSRLGLPFVQKTIAFLQVPPRSFCSQLTEQHKVIQPHTAAGKAAAASVFSGYIAVPNRISGEEEGRLDTRCTSTRVGPSPGPPGPVLCWASKSSLNPYRFYLICLQGPISSPPDLYFFPSPYSSTLLKY